MESDPFSRFFSIIFMTMRCLANSFSRSALLSISSGSLQVTSAVASGPGGTARRLLKTVSKDSLDILKNEDLPGIEYRANTPAATAGCSDCSALRRGDVHGKDG